ncbi:hypothetical protein Hypma_007024 [Hypsizygus marmoreus]|uniref:Uncharacterized protein n=1 Tax=Hypsizygus marmoreus TaxID=39966 RepID=A0A369K9Z9_HYPMA|nr:hypothetical protein Hypma_007024 [Hypsizygus marmoreus]
MGRRAKYFTQDERKSAEQAWKRETAFTPHSQMLRKAQNKRAYETRKCLSSAGTSSVTVASLPSASTPHSPLLPSSVLPLLPPSPSSPALPIQLTSIAVISIPNSYLFRQALESSDALKTTGYSDSELTKWIGPPPHALPPPKNSDHLMNALLRYRVRLQREHEADRLLRFYETKGGAAFAIELHEEFRHRFARWEELWDALGHISRLDLDGRMGWELLRWEAVQVVNLVADFTTLDEGMDPFLTLYVTRWLDL